MVGRGYFESQTPHFFKIVLSDALQNGRLGIPKKFVRKYGSSLSDLVFLRLASGDVWEVELLRGNDGAFLRRGWPDFVKHYAIEHGHFLVFRYEGGSAFRVVIFDKSATEIKYPLISENDDPRMEEDVGDASVEVFEDHSDQSRRNLRQELPSSTLLSPFSKKKKKKKKKTNEHLNKQEVGGGGNNSACDANAGLKSGYSRRYHPYRVSEKSEALERATSFQSPNPFFLAIMQPSFIRHCLSAPARFFMKYIPNFRSKGDIILYVSDERFWSVRYKFGIYGRRRQIKFNCGWKRFVQDNNLKLGDVCVFEIMWKVHQISFRVLIFRANGDTVEFEEASQHKLETSSSKSDKSQYGQAKNEESASNDQSAGKSFEVEPAIQMYTLLEARSASNVEDTSGTVSPSCITSIETASKFCTNQPSFRIVICPKHLNRCTPNVPAGFVRRFSDQRHIIGTLRVGHRTWPIKLCVYPHPNCNSFNGRISAGWFNFARHNALRVGDICIFELLISDLMVLKVSIFRKASIELR